MVQVYCESNDNHDLYYSSKLKRRDGSYELRNNLNGNWIMLKWNKSLMSSTYAPLISRFEMKEKNMEEYSTTATMVKVAIFNRVCRNIIHIKMYIYLSDLEFNRI